MNSFFYFLFCLLKQYCIIKYKLVLVSVSMVNFTEILKKFKSPKNKGEVNSNQSQVDNDKPNVKNWYEERYDTIIVQRNLFFLLLMVFLALSIAAIITITIVIESKRFDPFVIQVDETTGMTKIVNPTTSDMLEGNESLSRYFIKKYLIARETYNPVDFDTQARQVIRLLSSSNIFWNYITSLRNQLTNPSVVYGQKNSTFLTVKSWSKLDTKKYLVRFSVTETAGSQIMFHKIAIVDFSYTPMDLTDVERDINPIGFQVQGYRVDDDNS